MAGPLVFCLAFGGFLLLVRILKYTSQNKKLQNILFHRNLFFSIPMAVWKSHIFIHLRNRSIRMHRMLLFSHSNVTNYGDIWSCRFSFRLLSIANGVFIRNQCFNYNSVSLSTYVAKPKLMFNLFIILHRGMIGTVLTGIAILWCAVSASKLFVTALSMDHQQLLVAYPCALLYGVFALITIF